MSELESLKFRRGTSFKSKFPTLPSLDVQPRRVDIYQKQYTHDILVMEYSSVSPTYFESLQTGVPVEFTWTQDTLTMYWIGYISSVSKVEAPQRQNSMQIMCIGGTFPLKQRATKVFKNSTIPDAVRSIAVDNGFNFIGDAHSQVFEQLTMAGSSYWSWINEQAKRIGFGVLVDGMNLIFRRLDGLVDLGFSYSPILSMGNQGAPFNTQFLDRTLDYFQVLKGENMEDTNNSRTVKTAGGVDPITGTSFTASESPDTVGTNVRNDTSNVLFNEYLGASVVTKASDAKYVAEGAAQLARFNIPAKIQCQGDPRIRPFGTVFISGTGDLTDGFWVVREAHHMFHKIGDYQMEATIATDGVGSVKETTFRKRDASLSGTVNLEQALTNGGISAMYFSRDDVDLVYNKSIVDQNDQGFLRSSTRWASTRRGI